MIVATPAGASMVEMNSALVRLSDLPARTCSVVIKAGKPHLRQEPSVIVMYSPNHFYFIQEFFFLLFPLLFIPTPKAAPPPCSGGGASQLSHVRPGMGRSA